MQLKITNEETGRVFVQSPPLKTVRFMDRETGVIDAEATLAAVRERWNAPEDVVNYDGLRVELISDEDAAVLRASLAAEAQAEAEDTPEEADRRKRFEAAREGMQKADFVNSSEGVLALKERLDALVIETPYFQQAASLVLFAKEVSASYPTVKSSMAKVDDELRAEDAYDGLTPGQSATLLAERTMAAL